MRTLMPSRSRRPADRVMLVAVTVIFAVAVVRLVIAFVALPYVAYSYVQEQNEPDEALTPATTAGASEETTVTHAWYEPISLVDSWWGHRRFPRREGGDFIGVLSRQSTARSVGVATGVLVEEGRAEGMRIDRVYVPKNRARLYGEDGGTSFTQTDGTEYVVTWASFKRDIHYFSTVKVKKKEYDPLLTEAQYEQIAEETDLTERSNHYFMGEPVEGGSGTWILHARQNGLVREYLLIPIEVSPAGDEL